MNGINRFGFGSVMWSVSMVFSLLPNKRLVRTPGTTQLFPEATVAGAAHPECWASDQER
jgi:hypothetical protein